MVAVVAPGLPGVSSAAGWGVRQRAAGTACNGTGRCNGSGTCTPAPNCAPKGSVFACSRRTCAAAKPARTNFQCAQSAFGEQCLTNADCNPEGVLQGFCGNNFTCEPLGIILP